MIRSLNFYHRICAAKKYSPSVQVELKTTQSEPPKIIFGPQPSPDPNPVPYLDLGESAYEYCKLLAHVEELD
jgi:hypothetical protein